ncbi:MAG TPA: glycoside hydrolase family 97 C-terminal domain-containing protein, partial [Cyclobacteriaceae bacterium]|nr:glycoside hydrolase family 97 C-terminal domain-containing protein [Cyclobacteriaceae bacterium]
SGIQHYAESPEGMAHVPENIRIFLRELPNSWEDVKFIDGYPGKLYVVARKSGEAWYVAGINGENAAKSLSLDLSFLKNKTARLITNGSNSGDEPSFTETSVKLSSTGELNIELKENDGFIALIK